MNQKLKCGDRMRSGTACVLVNEIWYQVFILMSFDAQKPCHLKHLGKHRETNNSATVKRTRSPM